MHLRIWHIEKVFQERTSQQRSPQVLQVPLRDIHPSASLTLPHSTFSNLDQPVALWKAELLNHPNVAVLKVCVM